MRKSTCITYTISELLAKHTIPSHPDIPIGLLHPPTECQLDVSTPISTKTSTSSNSTPNHGAFYRLVPKTPFLDYTIMQTRNHWNYFKKFFKPVRVYQILRKFAKIKIKNFHIHSAIENFFTYWSQKLNCYQKKKFRLANWTVHILQKMSRPYSPQKKEKSWELMIMYLENLTICSLSNPYIQASYLNSTFDSAACPSIKSMNRGNHQNNSANNSHKCLATFSFELRIVKRYIFACRFGSNRNNTPTCAALVWMIPAATKFDGFGSTLTKICNPKPPSLDLICSSSIGNRAFKIFWLSWFGWFKIFHLVKNCSDPISAGSRNLHRNNGNFNIIFFRWPWS